MAVKMEVVTVKSALQVQICGEITGMSVTAVLVLLSGVLGYGIFAKFVVSTSAGAAAIPSSLGTLKSRMELDFFLV